MKIGIFNPYLDTLGGGERYMMTIAEYLSEKGHEVNTFWDDASLKNKILKRLGIDLSRVNFIEDIFSSKRNLSRTTTSWVRDLLKKWRITRKYDVIFYLSDGSIPFLFAKKNILHFQVPFTNTGGNSILKRIKLRRINRVVCNSYFTKGFIDQEYGVKSEVVYPPVSVEVFSPDKKENLILAVGRFSQSLNAKKQEVLIEVFRQLWEKKLASWRLILVGGLNKKDEDYYRKLKKLSSGLPVDLLANLGFNKLKDLYGKAKIFWHAAGFGENEKDHPERVEHFGITAVEAMASGCVPIVVKKGGLKEIVIDGENGLLWETKQDLVDLTLQLIKSPKKLEKFSFQAIKDSQKFSEKVFCQKIDEIVQN